MLIYHVRKLIFYTTMPPTYTDLNNISFKCVNSFSNSFCCGCFLMSKICIFHGVFSGSSKAQSCKKTLSSSNLLLSLSKTFVCCTFSFARNVIVKCYYHLNNFYFSFTCQGIITSHWYITKIYWSLFPFNRQCYQLPISVFENYNLILNMPLVYTSIYGTAQCEIICFSMHLHAISSHF